MMLDRPILITGTPRSGKSVLREVMLAADEFLCIEEPLMVWDPGPSRLDHDRRTAEDATPAVRDRIRADCGAMLARAGRDRYLDELAYHALRIPFVRAVMPEARIVHIVRGPEAAIPELLYGWTYRDTVGKAVARRWRNLRLSGLPRAALRFAINYIASRTRGRRTTWGPTPPGLHAFAAGHSIAEVAAFQWCSMVEIAMGDLEDVPPTSCLQIRFENLVADPRRELNRLVEFVQPRAPGAIVDRGLTLIDPAYIFEKKVHPSPDEWRRIRSQIGAVAERLEQHLPSPQHSPQELAQPSGARS